MIIKCPECGHQVSDKAPVCPSCGVEIAGKVIRCPHCGEIHFISDGICPNCHHSLIPRPNDSADNNISSISADGTEDTLKEEETLAQEERIDKDKVEAEAEHNEPARTEGNEPAQAESEEEPVQAIPITTSTRSETPSQKPLTENISTKKPTGNGSKGNTPKKKSHWPLIISLIIAATFCLILLFGYKSANNKNEEREYEQAIESRNPAILQSYLDTYTNAPTAHRDSVMALLNAIRASDPQWNKVKNSNDVNALKQYLQQNPNSPHKNEVLARIDELDWEQALQTHDFANYLALHQNGIHAAEAVDSVKLSMDMPASGADRQKAVSAVRSFLVAINSHNSDRVKNCFATNLEYFNEKTSVGSDEALNYMALIYRDAERLNWHVDNADAAKVSKTGEGSNAQYSIVMPARLSVNYTSGNNVQARYNVSAKVNGSGLITAIKLIRLAEEKASSSSESKPKSSPSSEKKSSSSSEKKSSSSEKKSSSSSKKSSSSEKKSSSSSSSSKKSSSSSKSSSSKKNK